MIHVVLGHQGSGKTWRLGRVLRELDERRRGEGHSPVILIHDQRATMDGAIGNVAAARWPAPIDCQKRGVEKGRLVKRSHLFHSCHPEEVCAMAWALSQQQGIPTITCIDELDRLDRVLNQRDSAAYRLINYGRPILADVIGSARRPANVDKCVLSEAAQIDVFQLADPRSLEHIRSTGWPNAAAVATRAPRLERYHYLTLCGDS